MKKLSEFLGEASNDLRLTKKQAQDLKLKGYKYVVMFDPKSDIPDLATKTSDQTVDLLKTTYKNEKGYNTLPINDYLKTLKEDSGDIADKYKEYNGTFYHKDTPDKLLHILDPILHNRTRIKIWYGDSHTGKAWGDVSSGRIGRSTGSIKIPLLVKTSRSMGGEALLDNAIVQLVNVQTGRVLYKHPNFQE